MPSKIKQHKTKKKVIQSNNKEHVLVVAQEIKFARLLSGNEKKQRDRVLKTLKKWLHNCFEKNYEFKEEDFIRVWKGLFNAVWMSDKPLVQEELCDNIGGILDEFPTHAIEAAGLMVHAGLRVLATSWYGIDQHRMDKFLMLVRRLLRSWFRCLQCSQWSMRCCRLNTRLLTDNDSILAAQAPLYVRNALSLQLHIVECYLEELAKVCSGSIPSRSLVELLRPFALYMCVGSERRLVVACRKHVFHYLMRQSELGQRDRERRDAWTQMGCPVGGPEALELVSEGEEEEEEDGDGDGPPPALDPRAGRVDVSLPELPVPAARLSRLLRDLARTTAGDTKARVNLCRDRLYELSRGVYPLSLDVSGVDPRAKSLRTPSSRKAALRLYRLERRLIADSDQLAVRGLSRKHKKRALAEGRETMSSGEKSNSLTTANGEWTVEEDTGGIKLTYNIEKQSKKRPHSKDEGRNGAKKRRVDVEDGGRKTVNVTTETKKVKPKTKKQMTQNGMKDNDKPNKVNYEKRASPSARSPECGRGRTDSGTPKRVKFVLKNNSMQAPVDYYKSVRKSPSIPFDGERRPNKTNLKPNATPSSVNPFWRKKRKT